MYNCTIPIQLNVQKGFHRLKTKNLWDYWKNSFHTLILFLNFRNSLIRLQLGCLIPSEDASGDCAHYVSKNDSLSLTNFAIMDESEAPDGGSQKSDDDIGVYSAFSMHEY